MVKNMIDLFKKDLSILKEKKLYLLDMDGTIYLGDKLFDCTLPFLKRIKDKGGRYIFVTNNSSKSVKDYVLKLKRLGIEDVKEEDFFTSTEATALILKKKFNDSLIYVQGTSSMVESLKRMGLNITTSFDMNAKCVLVGFDTELTFEKLENTSKMLILNKDIPYYATNPDWVCPTIYGSVPDCGSMCFSLYKASKRKPIFIGKPLKFMIEKAIEKYGYSKKNSVLIGDRLYTDIKSGNRANITTVAVLSGEINLDDVKKAKGKEIPTFTVLDLSYIS